MSELCQYCYRPATAFFLHRRVRDYPAWMGEFGIRFHPIKVCSTHYNNRPKHVMPHAG
jgi:hypothetical protein